MRNQNEGLRSRSGPRALGAGNRSGKVQRAALFREGRRSSRSEGRSKSEVNPSGLCFPAAYLARRTRKGACVLATNCVRSAVARPSRSLHPSSDCSRPPRSVLTTYLAQPSSFSTTVSVPRSGRTGRAESGGEASVIRRRFKCRQRRLLEGPRPRARSVRPRRAGHSSDSNCAWSSTALVTNLPVTKKLSSCCCLSALAARPRVEFRCRLGRILGCPRGLGGMLR